MRNFNPVFKPLYTEDHPALVDLSEVEQKLSGVRRLFRERKL